LGILVRGDVEFDEDVVVRFGEETKIDLEIDGELRLTKAEIGRSLICRGLKSVENFFLSRNS